MALDWWQLSLMVLGGVFLIRLMISPYFVYREKEKALHELDQKHKDSNEKIKQLSDTAIAFEKELREMRIKFRRIEESKASDIPITLSKMHKFVKETEGKKKNSKHKEDPPKKPKIVPQHYSKRGGGLTRRGDI